MDTEQLRYLIEVSKNTSITLASEKLFITPQAISISLKKLEDELGFPLLNRSCKGVSLTEDGLWLINLAEKFLSEIDSRKHTCHATLSAKQNNTLLRKGTLNIVTNILGNNNPILAQLICVQYREQPHLKINLSEVSKEDLFAKLSNGENELGFVYRTKRNHEFVGELPPDLVFEPLFYGRLVVMANESYDFIKHDSTSLKKIVKYPVCSYHKQNYFNDLGHLITDICKLDFNETIENNYDVFCEKIKNGIAIAIVVQFEIFEHPINYIENIPIVPLRDNIQIIFGMVKKKEQPLSENADFFMTELRNLIAQLR